MMGRRARTTALWFLAALTLGVEPVRADEIAARTAARGRFQSGIEAVERGQLVYAVEEFQAAYALSPEPSVLYNIGVTQSALGRPLEAVRALRAYLENQPNVLPSRRAEVEALILTNQRRLGAVMIDVAPLSAELEVDGATIVAGKVMLAAGRHVLVARAQGFMTGVLNVDVAAGTETAAYLVLEPLRPTDSKVRHAPAPQRDAARPAGAPAQGPPLVPLACGALGMLSLGLATGFVVSAKNLNHAAESNGHCDDSGCDELGYPIRAEARRYGNIATGFFLAGGALLGAGVTLYFVGRRDEAPTEARKVGVTARVDRTSARLGVEMGF